MILTGEKLVEKRGLQSIEVLQTKDFGKLLKLDNNTVFCEADEFIYHEMMAHTAINTHKEPQDILICGGATMGVAKEVLKHECVKSLTIVDIDENVTKVCKEHFEWVDGVLADSRVKFEVADAKQYVANLELKSFDIAIIDSDELLKSQELFENLYRVLRDDGLIVTQAKSYFLDINSHKEILQRVGKEFYIAMPFRYEMLSYEGGVYSFILASKKYHPTADINLQRADLMDGLKYYNSDIHIASFTKPTYIYRELLGVAKN